MLNIIKKRLSKKVHIDNELLLSNEKVKVNIGNVISIDSKSEKALEDHIRTIYMRGRGFYSYFFLILSMIILSNVDSANIWLSSLINTDSTLINFIWAGVFLVLFMGTVVLLAYIEYKFLSRDYEIQNDKDKFFEFLNEKYGHQIEPD